MNANFGDKRIALEPIPKDATAVVVRVETWEKMESDLATLRAELDAKTAEAVELKKRLEGCREMFLTVCRERDEARAAYAQVIKP